MLIIINKKRILRITRKVTVLISNRDQLKVKANKRIMSLTNKIMQSHQNSLRSVRITTKINSNKSKTNNLSKT